MTTSGEDIPAEKKLAFYRCELRDKASEGLYLNAQTSDVHFLICEPNQEDLKMEMNKLELIQSTSASAITDASKTEKKATTGKAEGEQNSSTDESKPKLKANNRKVIEKIPAHKLMLASASKVFEAMFYGPMKRDEIEIIDASAEAFKEFLQCFYLNNVQFTEEYIPIIMYLADKYLVIECLETCTSSLKDTLKSDKICWGYKLAIWYDQYELQLFCEHQIALNAVQVFGSPDFLHCDRSVLKHILQINQMPCNETIVFDSCMAWAKTTCEEKGLDAKDPQNLRAMLGHCLYLIRFGTFTMEEFTKRTMNYNGLFTADEFADIIHSLTVKEYDAKYFSQTKRYWWDASKIWKCQRTTTNSNACYYVEGIETIHITVNKTTLLGGIHVVPLGHRNNVQFKKDARITINEIPGQSFDRTSGKTLYSGTINFINAQASYVKLPMAILINERNTYEIRLDMEHFNDCYVGQTQYTSVKVDSPKGLSMEFIFDIDRGRMISALDLNEV